MHTANYYSLWMSILSIPFIFSSAGCGSSAPQDGPTAGAAAASGSEAGCCTMHGPQSPAADSDVREALAQLPPEDRALAEKQKFCPVTDAPLGSMGVPTKVTVKGHAVLLCCGGCADRLNKDADKYLAKLGLAEAK